MDCNLFYSKTEYPYPSTTTSELDFVQHWVEQTIDKEILRGKQLQQLKERTPVVQEYDVVNVDDGQLPCCEPGGSQSSAKKPQRKTPKKGIRKLKKGKKEECGCTCRCPKSSRKRKAKQKCPMRIAELAVPTKRQCLQNWINNKDILPEIMIHRLQQIIRDQRPVVKISDAIYCFKIHRSKRKCKSKKCEKKDIKCLTKNLNKAKNLSDARVFCGVFAHRIGQILSKPMVIELSAELDRIANVVTMDIADLLHKNHLDFGKIKKKKSMLDETASKIAIWIWTILEEANNLILEDQLKELEEEIGPVLDIVDDLVDSVVDICYVEPIIEDISSESSTDAKVLEEVAEEHESKKKIHVTDSFTDLDRLSDDIHDHITNQICSIINNLGDNDSDILSKFSFDQQKGNLEDEKLSQQSLDDKEFVDADDHNQDNFPSEQNPEALKHNFELEERDEERNQVSDDFNDGKKVTFSQFNTVKDTKSKGGTSSEDESDYDKVLNWKASLNKFVFAEPNDHLLCDADELWPQDIIYDEIVKTTISINKSISSMGKIFETEERASTAPTVEIEHLHERELDKVGDTPSTSLLNKDITESKAVQTSIDKSNFDYYKKLRETGINTSPSSSTTSRRKKGKTVTSQSLSDFGKKSTVRVKSRLNYKVCPCTAPAWAMQGFYESSEGSRHKKQINQCQLRKWCNDLLTGYNNLKLWGNWLEETSRMVTKLKQKEAKCCPKKRKYAKKWVKLKKEIDDDAIIWNRKHRCTKKQFAEYKDLYRDNLVPKIKCKCSKKIR